MDNDEFSKLVSSRVSTQPDFARTEIFDNAKRKKRRKNGNDTKNDEKRTSLVNNKKRPSTNENHKSTTLTSGGNSTYRDRAKERRDGKTNENGLLFDDTEERNCFISASDAKFEAIIDDFETQNLTNRSGEKQSNVSESLVDRGNNRSCFQTADNATQWIDGYMPELPSPKSDTAKRIVELLKRKQIQATPQHLSLHRSYYTFGTQWNPWWERPMMSTYYGNQNVKQPWTPLPEEVLNLVGKSCQAIAKREAESRQLVSSPQDPSENNHVPESSDEDDIFAGAGEYDASVAIKETVTKKDKAVLDGESIFGVVNWRHTEPVPENVSGATENERKIAPLQGFSEGLDHVLGVDMDFEVVDVDPKSKKKKKRRKKDDNDSD